MSQVIPVKKEIASKRRGQALAEFALTLPILLLLVFGIIEFARLFQTWVVLQSAARAGARTASIGGINYDIFETAPSSLPDDLRVLNGIVVCTEDDDRGNKVTDIITGAQYYDGEEGLFATLYDGTNCSPTNEEHLQLRRDILRIFTVIAAVREAAGTIAVYETRVDQPYDQITAATAFDFFKGYWNKPYRSPENSAAPGWISIEMCSSRPLMNGESVSNEPGRFIMLRNSTDVSMAKLRSDVVPVMNNYPLPFCMLNEDPAGSYADSLNNMGQRWFDVGGPGDRVTVFIKFNHPLITPLNLAQYVHLESRRSSVNESFRAPKAVGAFQRSIPPGRDPEDPGPPAPQPTDTPTLENTPTFTATPTATDTNTPEPFTCENIKVFWAEQPFQGPQLFMGIQNLNADRTTLMRVRLGWQSKSGYQLMYAQSFSLDGIIHWLGTPPSSPPQELIDTRTDGVFNNDAPRDISRSAIWGALFNNGPSAMQMGFSLADFNAEFEFANPLGSPCIITLDRVTEFPTPVPTITPVGPTPTPTPSCDALSNIQIQHRVDYNSFDGSVIFNLYNTGTLPVYLLGFQLVWPDRTHPDIPAGATYYLRRVTVGGINADDPFSVEVWRSSGANQDATGNKRKNPPYEIATASNNLAEGTWRTNAILRPGDNFVYLDFDGLSGSFSQFKTTWSHFDRSLFYIGWAEGCTGPGGGPGSIPTSSVQVDLPTPTLTNTPRPTNTPAPTLTPTNTRPSNTPSRTNTLRPTATRTNTPINTNTHTRTPLGYTPTAGSGGE